MIIMLEFVSGRRAPVALLGATALVLSACAPTTQPSNTDDSITVVVGAYPFEFAAQRVAGEHVEVTNLLAPGADSHGLELSPQQVAAVSAADLVIHQSGYQPALDEAIAQQQPAIVLDTGDFVSLLPASGDGEVHEHSADDHHDHSGYDPHIWLDPTNLVEVADQIAARLAEVDPGNADTYRANADALDGELIALDQQFASGLASCRTDTFITNHAAFGYLAHRYLLHQVGVSGLSTETEPSPARIAEVQQIARDHDVTTIFYETSVSGKLAETIASDLGLQTDVLDPLETLSPDARGDNYLEVMTANLEALRKANGCQ